MAFRVTNQMMSQRMLENLWASMRRLDKWNQQLSTGRRISLPSDDPADTETAMRLRTLLREGEQYVRNVDDALAWLEATDAALNHATQVLQRARELIIYGGNGTLTDEARQALATEMNQLIHDLFAVANTKHGQRYLFAGENTLIRPFEAILEEPADPSSPVVDFQYHGTRYEPADGFDGLELEIEAGNTLRYNIFGNDVFEPIFDVLIAVREHLENGNLNDLTGDDL
ncbi:MAG: flagellar hook-associated protein FlgL, partial [Bacillota bacterium]